MTPTRLALFALWALSTRTFAQDEPPRSLDPRLKIELFAENPQIATPTGIDVDHAGRVWAIESNTHFPPEGYQGHPTDRVLVMEDTDGDHKADKITVFKDGLTHTMSVAVKPVWLDMASGGRESLETSAPNSVKEENSKEEQTRGTHVPRSPGSVVFIATRREILLCTDTDGDLKCDQTKRLVHLETTGNYPHNGLAGFAFDALGNMFFGFGENLGADYKIIGSDGITLSGGGEGGNVYRCRPDGSKLERWATGFWNPHASCFDAFGRLFTLDNDPDSRPPCRLLHIIPGGDYGYRFRNGRKGTHPFTAWNGEIPGTLPMVSGTGEAPSGIVCYESDGFPEDYLGTLLVGSWGDHRIDKFVLKPRGASFESFPQPVIKGGENFRPVGLALTPDGSLYVTDWVLKDYKLHGKGRVWRVSAKEEPKREIIDAAMIHQSTSVEKLAENLNSRRIDIRRHSAKLLRETLDGKRLLRREASKGLVGLSGGIPKLERSTFEARLRLDLFGQVDRMDVLRKRSVDSLFFMEPIIVNQVNENIELGDRETFSHAITRMSLYAVDDQFLLDWMKRGFVPIYEDPFAKPSVRKDRAARHRLACLLLTRRTRPQLVTIAAAGLNENDADVRRAAVQWVGEENLKELRPEVEKVLASEPMTNDLFMACLASLSMLDGVPPAEFEKAPPVQHVLPIVKDEKRSASLRAIALRMLSPTLKELDAKLLGEMLIVKKEEPGDLRPPLAGELRREAVRTLQHSPISERDELLRPIAADESLDANLRADAVAGLAPVDHHAKLNDATRDLLLKLLRHPKSSETSDVSTLAVEAVRSLRGTAMAKPDQPTYDAKVADSMKRLAAELKIEEPEDSRRALGEAVAFALGKRSTEKPSVDQLSTIDHQPSAEAGRRVFFNANSAGCFKCHTVGGRGGQVGPDLTVIARTMDRQKLAESILEPSKEISPQFTTWAVETTSGKVLTGMLLGEELNGDLRLGDNSGKVFFIPFKDIESRQPLKSSIMPEKLHEQLTPSEFRDLIAYLETLK